MRLAGDGDRPLLHGLEQGRLRLGRGPVDLVGQHEVGEDRPALELEPAEPPSGDLEQTLVPIRSAGIRSGVNWIRWNFRWSASASVRTSKRLAQPRHAFEQDVPAGDQGGQRLVDDLPCPTMTLPISRRKGLEVGAELVNRPPSDHGEAGPITMRTLWPRRRRG